MSRVCTVCTHAERAAIDAALLADVPFRHIAAQYGTSTTALQRHKADHIPAATAQAQQAADVAKADSLLDQVRELQARAMALWTKRKAPAIGARPLVRSAKARGNLRAPS